MAKKAHLQLTCFLLYVVLLFSPVCFTLLLQIRSYHIFSPDPLLLYTQKKILLLTQNDKISLSLTLSLDSFLVLFLIILSFIQQTLDASAISLCQMVTKSKSFLLISSLNFQVQSLSKTGPNMAKSCRTLQRQP